LPSPQSELASQILKDPYNFDFLSYADAAHERDLERGLLAHLKHFMLELGAGFAFIGSQHHLEVNSKDYYLDLLFFYYRLHCFVIVDLKMTEFKPEYAGKMNFYLSAVDDLMRSSGDAPTIGLILCKNRDRTDSVRTRGVYGGLVLHCSGSRRFGC
jgi:YhcG PDDEXK nuclease domain